MLTASGRFSQIDLEERLMPREPQALLRSYPGLLPALAGCLMVFGSIVPWLVDPLGRAESAWQLPIDIGWQFHPGILNYGLLCLCCAIYAWAIAYAHWRPFRGHNHLLRSHVVAGLLCLVPLTLFAWQYLFTDLVAIDVLAQHKIQLLLVQQHFGYSVAAQLIPINPFQFDASTLWGRLELFIDQVSPGCLLLLVAAGMLIYSQRFVAVVHSHVAPRRWFIVAVLLALLLLGRGPAAMACEYEAKVALTTGNYSSALSWLNVALILNPALNQVASYHIERGQVLYFSRLDVKSDDSSAYLAATYGEQGDYLRAYQQLLAVWQAHPTTSWVVNEMSAMLERQAEFISPLDGPPVRRPRNDTRSLPWLQLLAQVDTSNFYSRYVIGRIHYDLHNYAASINEMAMVLHLSTDADVQSSAYTYMALSEGGQGNFINERRLLMKALELDPHYHNNTAREDLSGLR